MDGRCSPTENQETGSKALRSPPLKVNLRQSDVNIATTLTKQLKAKLKI